MSDTRTRMEEGGWVYLGNGTYATPADAKALADPERQAQIAAQWQYYFDLLEEEKKRGQPQVAC